MPLNEEIDLSQFQELLKLYKSRFETYGKSIIKSVLVKKEGEWHNILTMIKPSYYKEESSFSACLRST